jgi:hypothetical protein
MKVNCLGCGHLLRLDAAYDDYHGCIKCNICRAVMEIQSEEGKLKTVKLVGGSLLPNQ